MSLQQDWDAFLAIEPPDVPDNIGGVDLPLLADDTTDCISVFLATGSIDPENKGRLRACEAELRAVLPELTGPAADYLARLLDLARATLQWTDRNRPSWLAG